jgi:hypothetical protein
MVVQSEWIDATFGKGDQNATFRDTTDRPCMTSKWEMREIFLEVVVQGRLEDTNAKSARPGAQTKGRVCWELCGRAPMSLLHSTSGSTAVRT